MKSLFKHPYKALSVYKLTFNELKKALQYAIFSLQIYIKNHTIKNNVKGIQFNLFSLEFPKMMVNVEFFGFGRKIKNQISSFQT